MTNSSKIIAGAAPSLQVNVEGTAGADKPGFNSYFMKSGRWTVQALKTDHDNIVDSKVWAVARRVMAVVVGVVGMAFGAIADAFRGIAYNIKADYIGRFKNSGTAPLSKISKAFNFLQPTKNFYKATARNIAGAYQSGGNAVDWANPNDSWFRKQPWATIENAIREESRELANRFVNQNADQIKAGMKRLEKELTEATKKAPHYYPDKVDTTKAFEIVSDAMGRIREELEDAVVDAIAEASIGSDGKFSAQRRNEITDKFVNAGVLDAASVAKVRKSIDEKGAEIEIAEAGQRAKKASQKAKQGSAEAANEESKTSSVAGSNDETSSVDAASAKKAEKIAAEKAKTISDNFDKAIKILTKMVENQNELKGKFIAILEDLRTREAMVVEYKSLRTKIIGDLQAKGYKLDAIVDAMALGDNGHDKVIAEAVKPLKELRKRMTNEKKLSELKKQVEKIGQSIQSLNGKLAKVKMPSTEEFEKYATADQKEKADRYNQLVNEVTQNNGPIETTFNTVLEREVEARNNINHLTEAKPEFHKKSGMVDASEFFHQASAKEQGNAQPTGLRWAVKQVPLLGRLVS